jgi:hypothetical protein
MGERGGKPLLDVDPAAFRRQFAAHLHEGAARRERARNGDVTARDHGLRR